MALLGQDGQHAGNTNAIRTHGRNRTLAVFIQDLHVKGLGVFAAQLEDMAELNAALQGQGALVIGSQVAFFNLCGLNELIHGEIAAGYAAHHVALARIGAGNPRRALDHTRIGQDLDAIGVQSARANIALDQEVIVCKVLVPCQLNFHRLECGLKALFIQLAVARNENGCQLGLALFALRGRVVKLDHHALEGVCSGGLAAVDSNACALGPFDQLLNGLCSRGVMLLCLWLALDILLRRCRGHHGLDVGCVVALGGAHKGILAHLRDGEEFLGGGAAHGTRGGLTDGVIDL